MYRTKDFIEDSAVGVLKHVRRGVEFELGSERMSVEFITDEILKMRISKGGVFDPKPSFAVVCDEFGTPEFSFRATKNGFTLKGKKLTAVFRTDVFSYTVRRADGTIVCRSTREGAYRFLNNEWSIARTGEASDAYFGFGEKTGPLNQNGRYLQFWNNDVLNHEASTHPRLDAKERARIKENDPHFDPYYMSIPFYYHMRDGLAAGFFIDNACHLHIDLTQKKGIEICGENGQYAEYIIAGPAVCDILKNYNLLTEHPSPAPLWALGHHQCRYYPYDEKSIAKLADDYRKKKIPCDVLWFDIDYMDGYRVFTWDKKRYPDVDATLAGLKAKGFRAITIIDPGVKYEKGYPVFDEGVARDVFCRTESNRIYTGSVWPGRTAFPDFVREEPRRWWGRLNADHVKKGLAGIWNDMNEPASFDNVDAMRFDNGRASHDRWHNSYAMLMAMGTVEGLRSAMPGLRTFVLSRAGSAGIQRYAANWTGDNISCFPHLAMSATMNCNLALSGQPFCGSDIGGFAGNSCGELLVRWYQYGAFMPFMRNHSSAGEIDQYPWSFGKKNADLIRAAVEGRYRLLPYIYTAFMRYPIDNVPLQRPLVFDYQSDPKCRDNSTEFLFGPSFLVAPVTRAGATKRRLYLPAGDWYDFRDGKPVKGGRNIVADAPLASIPVYVRAGSVIPLAPVRQSTLDDAPDTITLRVYSPAKDGETVSRLYEDDGLTERFVHGEYLTTEIRVCRAGKKLTVTGRVSGNGFPENTRKKLRVEFVGINAKPQMLENAGSDFNCSVTL